MRDLTYSSMTRSWKGEILAAYLLSTEKSRATFVSLIGIRVPQRCRETTLRRWENNLCFKAVGAY